MKSVFTDAAFTQAADRVRSAGGSATQAGEKREEQGLGLDPRVDPAGYDLIRRSLPRYTEQKGKRLLLPNGIPMLVENVADTTGSMGDNVNIIFTVLPRLYNLLSSGEGAVLRRYDLQVINGIFGDAHSDKRIYQRSMAEMDIKIAEQLELMVPEGNGGGNGHENPEYALFGAAYLTDAYINRYDLKSYHFTVSDEPLEETLYPSQLVRVYGDQVFEKVTENGFKIKKNDLPTVREVVQYLLKRAHGFFLQVGDRSDVKSQWTSIYGKERVVSIPNVELLPYMQAAIIGLTEGVLNLQTLKPFLIKNDLEDAQASQIVRAVAGIPIGAQMILPNFAKLPPKGSVFAKRHDLWPIKEGVLAGASEDEEDSEESTGMSAQQWL